MKRLSTLLALCLLVFGQISLLAQQQSPLDLALRHIEQSLDEWGLVSNDIVDIVVSDQYVSKHTGVTHLYFIQRYANVPVHNAINGVHITLDGKVAFSTNRFVDNLAERINTTSPQLSAYQALEQAAQHLGVSLEQPLRLIKQEGSRYTFNGGELAHNDIRVRPMYTFLRNTDEVRLSWDMAIDQIGTADYWSIRVDALTGEILEKSNFTVYCNFDHQTGKKSHADNCAHETIQESARQNYRPVMEALKTENMFTLNDGASYNVFPIPVESPIHGDRELVVDPADPVASPYGWHDTNAQDGAEFTITRGNNVHAYLDLENINTSLNDEPDGGEELVFDYFYDINEEPDQYRDAAVTQLFYMNNIMHDVMHHYGFDEASGNFQRLNYSGDGQGNDFVFAEAQDGSEGTNPETGQPYANNANFSTPDDGANGRMQMYLWDRSPPGLFLNVLSPENIAGGFISQRAGFGPEFNAPLEAEIVRAVDASVAPLLACETIDNASDVAGKIALIDRGDCFFEIKVNNAQDAGAIAVIVCNYEEDLLTMGNTPTPNPNIPSILITNSDCITIVAAMEQGPVMARLAEPEGSSGPTRVDADFDNGIIAHEYGHGISNRLTGGPSSSDCLFNNEQMGEGWSDFFALIMTIDPNDTGETPRGVGNYTERRPPNGGGIRRRPYSTDWTINNQTYDDIVSQTGPHPLGEVWASVTWDLYWAMVDAYGYDDDIYNGTGGNNMAIQLVMDGMKYQACFPGFQDGRDAILAADFVLFDGANQCLIWEIFARRGLGWDFDQGSSFTRYDGRQGFQHNPECIKELYMVKTSDVDFITAGEDVEITIELFNYKDETVTDVIIMEDIPEGMGYVPGSGIGADIIDNGSSLMIEVGDMDPMDDIQFRFTLTTDPNRPSISNFLDDIEQGDQYWFFEAPEGFDTWEVVSDNPNSGDLSWFIPNTENPNEHNLVFIDPIEVTGTNPAIRFFHSYETEFAWDAGLVEISNDGGGSWVSADELFIRNGYRGLVEAPTFGEEINAFWGITDGYVSPYIDLSSYSGQSIYFRFRFKSDAEVEGVGWWIDDFEIIDLQSYNGETCATSAEGDVLCLKLPNGGVLVETGTPVGVDDPIYNPEVLQVFPNPASQQLNIALTGEFTGKVDVQLLASNGLLVREWPGQELQGRSIPISVADLPAGFYFIQVNTSQGIYTEKVVIQ